MKHVTMADKSLMTGDEAADALLAYAALMARINQGDQVTIRAITTDGEEGEVGFLLNSGTVLLIETSTSTLPEPDNRTAVAYMRQRLADYSPASNEESPFDTLEHED